jgi:hypothetical protein
MPYRICFFFVNCYKTEMIIRAEKSNVTVTVTNEDFLKTVAMTGQEHK